MNKAVLATIYDDPAYWNGDIGYRSPGYRDFDINVIKEAVILLMKPESVLDIGCAYGYSVGRFNDLGIKARGIDISQYALSQAPDYCKPYLVHAPAWDIPFKDKEFDVIFSSGILEHVPEDKMEHTVAEIVRVSSRGVIGVSCLDDPSTHKEDDTSHCVMLKCADWQALFPADYVVVSDSSTSWKVLLLTNLWRALCQ